jgi:hypothetical protein
LKKTTLSYTTQKQKSSDKQTVVIENIATNLTKRDVHIDDLLETKMAHHRVWNKNSTTDTQWWAELNFTERLSSPSAFSRVLVARSLVFCIVFWWSLFVPFLDHCIFCPYLNYVFWLPIWYIQAFLYMNVYTLRMYWASIL